LTASTAVVATAPTAAANAVLVLNEDGEYEQVEEPTWQEAWKGRLDKASTMSTDQVFMAARGAGNQELKDGQESESSKKRRAFAGCRDSNLRAKAGVPDAKDCSSRVLSGETDFMLQVL
jgi:hypothetical protein